MKNLELQSLGLMELDAEEMCELEGGIWPIVLLLGAAAALLSGCNNRVENHITINVNANANVKADSNNVHVGMPRK